MNFFEVFFGHFWDFLKHLEKIQQFSWNLSKNIHQISRNAHHYPLDLACNFCSKTEFSGHFWTIFLQFLISLETVFGPFWQAFFSVRNINDWKTHFLSQQLLKQLKFPIKSGSFWVFGATILGHLFGQFPVNNIRSYWNCLSNWLIFGPVTVQKVIAMQTPF